MRFNLLHLIMLVTAMVAAMVATASHATTGTKGKGWKMTDRFAFNDACTNEFVSQAKASKHKYDVKVIHNFCDCISGEAQYRYTIEEWMTLDNQRPMQKSFVDFMTKTALVCLQDPT